MMKSDPNPTVYEHSRERWLKGGYRLPMKGEEE